MAPPSVTSATLRPISAVLGFDIIELWSTSVDGTLTCDNFYHSRAVEVVVQKIFPDSAPFHPKVSPTWMENSTQLCAKARFESESGGHVWAAVDHRKLLLPIDEERKSLMGVDDVALPVATEVVIPVTNEENDLLSFLICYTRAAIDMTPVKVKFLKSIAAAALIASTNFRDYSLDDAELDNKNNSSKPISAYGSGLHLDDISEDMSVEMGCWSGHSAVEKRAFHNELGEEEFFDVGEPPTWDPVDSYNFPVGDIPPALEIPDNLRFDNFSDLKHIADGSNSNVYTGKFRGQSVIIKIITEKAKTNKIAVHEFDVEHGMLARMNHPNIVKLVGAGRYPRRFIVLEHLAGGSLTNVLSGNEQTGLAKKFFKKNTFSWPTLLKMAKDVADAFNYCHTCVHPGASILHRDLKPDNVGFTEDGSLKLFDFGLCTLVKRSQSAEDTYEMTGNTGSLRYMAGEVALRLPYNEKADVYSYGILLWQMAKDKVPFKGMNRADFMNQVVRKGVRPKIDKTWPRDFVALLESCWHVDFTQRPSFEVISQSLTKQILQDNPKAGRPNRRSSFQAGGQTQSTWF